MAQGKIKIPIFKGINQSFPEMDMAYAAEAENMDVSDGILKVCNGITKKTVIQAQSAIKSLVKLNKKADGIYVQVLIIGTQSDVYVWDEDGYYGIKTAMTSGGYAYLNYQLNGEDICILTNGEQTPFYTNGIYCTDMQDVPKFADIALHYERMWGCGVDGYPDRVYYSKSFDPTDFSTLGEAGFIDIPSFDGNPIVAIEVLFDDVVVFKQDSMYRIIGTYPGTYEVSKIHGVVGPIASKTVVNVGSMALFLSTEGLCIYDGVKAVPFKPKVLKNIYARINKTKVEQAIAMVYNNKVLVALPIDGAEHNNAILEYDTIRDIFTLRTGFCVESFLVLDDVLYFSNGTSYIYAYDTGKSNDGLLIEAFWETPFTDAGDRATLKYLQNLYAFGKGDDIEVSVITEKTSKQKVYALNPDSIKHIKFKLQGKGVRFKLRFANTQGGYFELVSPEVHFEKDA